MKQTAVEWLEKEIENISIQVFDGYLTFVEFMEQREKLFNQAKEMEKEQKIEFAEKMRLIQDVDFDGNITFAFDPRIHLETFKSE